MADAQTQQLEQRVLNLLQNKFPITKGGVTLELTDIKIRRPNLLGDIDHEYEIKLRERDLYGSVRGNFILKKDGAVLDESGPIRITSIPYKTQRGTYLIGGQEKVVLNQLRSKPGPFLESSASGEAKTKISFQNYALPQITAMVDKNKDSFTVSVGDKNFAGVNFLRYIGSSEQEIRDTLGRDDFADRIIAGSNRGPRGGLEDLFNLTVNYRAKGKNVTFPANEEKAIALIQKALSENADIGEDGADVAGVTLGMKTRTFDKSAVLAAVKRTFDAARTGAKGDNRSDLMFQRAMSGTDLIFEAIEKDINSFVSRVERIMETQKGKMTIKSLLAGLGKVEAGLKKFMSRSELSDNTEQSNILNLLSDINKVTSLGPGGLSSQALETLTEPRNLKPTGINRLDPVQTPEGNIGVVSRLAQDAEVRDGTIIAKVYNVKDGVAEISDKNLVEITPHQEYNNYVAFNDPRRVERAGNEYRLKGEKVPGRYKGKMQEIDVDLVKYLDKAPQSLFSHTTNLIPFGQHNDGNRMLMGANMQTQATNLVKREVPLVQVATDPDKAKTYEDVVGDMAFTVRAPKSGTVTSVSDKQITIKGTDGGEEKIKIYDYFPLNRNNFVNNEPVVKSGQKVKEGDLLAEGWQTRDGKLALGVNARVGFMPYKGYNFEDGMVISEGLASRMASEELSTTQVFIKSHHIGGPGSKAKNKLHEHLNSPKSTDHLDEDGIVKPDKIVKPGDILVARLKPIDIEKMDASRQIYAMAKNAPTKYADASEYIPDHSYRGGKVTKVEVLSGKQAGMTDVAWVVNITISTVKPLKLGDKLAGRHGNKGTITKIMKDTEMPVAEDGKPLELIYSPLAVPSRKNLGQLLEVNAGLVAEKTGKPYITHNFSPEEKDRVLKALEEIGLPDGKMKVFDPVTKNAYENPVTVGNMYLMKLKHKVDDKIQSRSAQEGAPPSSVFHEPSKQIGNPAGEKHNPQRLGEMEMWALQAHKAVNNIFEANTLKGDGAGDTAQRIAIFRALSGEKPLDSLEDFNFTPQSLRVLNDNLTALGLKTTPLNMGKRVKNIDDTFNEIMLTPAKPDELLKLIGKENKVMNHKGYMARLTGDDIAEPGGLFDPKIFGEVPEDPENRNRWGYIKLSQPLPNPIFMADASFNPYAELTPFKKSELDDIMNKNVVVVTNPGDTGLKPGSIISGEAADNLVVEGKKFEWKAGGDAIAHYLEKVNVDSELKKTSEALKEAKGQDRDALYKRFRMLNSLKKNDIKPKDLMLSIVPVAPVYLRPRKRDGDNIVADDLTKLYNKLVQANNNTSSTLGNPQANAPSQLGGDSTALYGRLTDLYGMTEAIDVERDGHILKGFKDRIGGKEGLVRKRMLGKRQDYSGRAVIGVDPKLKLNQVGIPTDIAKLVYKPFIVKELVNTGRADNHEKAEDKIDNMDSDARWALERVVKDRPVMINRAPSLHKFNVQAFDPVITDYQDGHPVRTIQLNPLVVTGFNADFDGDTMSVHVPVSDKANEEAKKLMRPSQNMINPTNGSFIIEIKNEMLLGLYYLTMNPDKPEGKEKQFETYAALKTAFLRGDVKSKQKASLRGVTQTPTTVGQILVNAKLPQKHARWGKVIGKGAIRELLMAMHEDEKIPRAQLSDIIDTLKEIGFEGATRSSLSIGVKDLKKPEELGQRLDQVIKNLDVEVEGNESKLIAALQTVEDEVEREFAKGKVLSPDNPVQIMLMSGSRGNPSQIRRMSAIVGLGVDVEGKTTAPVLNSHLDGLSPHEFWVHSFDSRKGMYDRSVGTKVPGALSREVWSANQDIVIVDKDCGTTEGVMIAKKNRSVPGRYTAEVITGRGGKTYLKKGEKVTKQAWDVIQKDDSVVEIKVRSPLTCESANGLCQKCYGAVPGTIETPALGEPVGVLAAQAMGEPVTQMTMKTFHGGGTDTNVTAGLPRLQEILGVSKSPANKAILSKASGPVTIEQSGDRVIVDVGGIKHTIDHGVDGTLKPLRVKDGDHVEKGDFLTVGDTADLADPRFKNVTFTSANPMEIITLDSDNPRNAVRRVQDYLTSSMEHTFSNTLDDKAIDRRHLEVTVGKLTSKVKIDDPSNSSFLPGQVANRVDVERWNANNATPFNAKTVSLSSNTKDIIGARIAGMYKDKKGGIILRDGEVITPQKLGELMLSHNQIKIIPKPIGYTPDVASLGRVVSMGHDNWLSNLGHEDVRHQLARGAAFGQTDQLEDIRGRQIAGKMLNIGEGFNMWDRAKDFAGNIMDMFR